MRRKNTRRHTRYCVHADLCYANGELRIRDISAGGVGVQLGPSERPDPGGDLNFFISGRSELFGPFRATVIWVQKTSAGIKFSDACREEEIARAVESLRNTPVGGQTSLAE